MTGSFILDYFILVFLASTGVFQMATSSGGFCGLLFLKHRSQSLCLGLVLLAGAFAWFFLSEPRNVPDSALGMNGNEQFGYFFAGSGAGLTFTLIVSSLRNWSLGAGKPASPPGLDALRESSYLRALYRSITCYRPRIRRSRVAGRGPGPGWLPFLPGKSPRRSASGPGLVRRIASGIRREGFLRRWKRSWS